MKLFSIESTGTSIKLTRTNDRFYMEEYETSFPPNTSGKVRISKKEYEKTLEELTNK